MKKEEKLTPSLPKGFRDRWGKELALKKNIIKIIEANFIKYGFLPLETSPTVSYTHLTLPTTPYV